MPPSLAWSYAPGVVRQRRSPALRHVESAGLAREGTNKRSRRGRRKPDSARGVRRMSGYPAEFGVQGALPTCRKPARHTGESRSYQVAVAAPTARTLQNRVFGCAPPAAPRPPSTRGRIVQRFSSGLGRPDVACGCSLSTITVDPSAPAAGRGSTSSSPSTTSTVTGRLTDGRWAPEGTSTAGSSRTTTHQGSGCCA